MYYIVYKITNKINGKYYIGSHKTSDLNDAYMGSGKYLRNAQKKHGLHNFTKEVLYVFDTAAEMYSKEAELVTEDLIKSKTVYNVKCGGLGGWDYVNEITTSTDKSTAGKIGRKKTDAWIKQVYGVDNVSHIPIVREKRSRTLKKRIEDGSFAPYDWTGKQHRTESKAKIGQKNSVYQRGSGNSQYGTMWITNGVENKKTPKDTEIPSGWRKGRAVLKS